LETGRLEVTHSLENVEGKGQRLTTTKSEKSRRILRIPQICLKALAKQRIAQAKEMQWAGSKWKNGDFVFTTSVGTPMNPDEISHVFPTVLKNAGLPKVRFHDLRHTCASLLLSLGVPAKLV
jgi:integrase